MEHIYAGHTFDPEGNPISPAEFERRRPERLPSEADKVYLRTLMQPVMEPGKMAHWIVAPDRGIKGLPIDYEYIRRV